MRVTLTWFEIYVAAEAGILRNVEAMKRGRHPAHGAPPHHEGWNANINGAVAELAVAKALGRYWEPVCARPHELDGDVGDVQVRSTVRPDGHLIVREKDPDGADFYLVTGVAPVLEVRGSIIGALAKQPEWLRPALGDRPPAYFVPQAALTPL